LGARLDSKATVGEGTQNYLCAAQAAAVLITLAVLAVWPGGWWLDPAVGLAISAVALWEGIEAWRGELCTSDAVRVRCQSTRSPLRRTRRAFSTRHRIIDAQGRTHHVVVVAAQLFDEHGDVIVRGRLREAPGS
jgi:hypothetical protein